jgi:hypothetical protein
MHTDSYELFAIDGAGVQGNFHHDFQLLRRGETTSGTYTLTPLQGDPSLFVVQNASGTHSVMGFRDRDRGEDRCEDG